MRPLLDRSCRADYLFFVSGNSTGESSIVADECWIDGYHHLFFRKNCHNLGIDEGIDVFTFFQFSLSLFESIFNSIINMK